MKTEYATHDYKNKRGNVYLWIPLIILAGLVAGYFIFPDFQKGINEAFEVVTSEDPDRIKTWVKRFGALGPIILLLSMTVQTFLIIIPNLLLFIIAIVCYGPVWGSLICLTGIFASSSIGFFIGRKLGPGAIDRFVSEKSQQRVSLFVERYGSKAIAIARLSSVATDALGFVAGALEMKYRKFIAATMAGVLPVIILIAVFGNRGKIERALLIIGGISLVILVVYIFLDKKKHRQA